MTLFDKLNPDASKWVLNDVNTLLGNATTILLSVAGVVAAIFIVIGGFQYFTAYGDEAKAEAGKKTLLWAIIGLAFIIVGKLVLGEIWLFFSGSILPL